VPEGRYRVWDGDGAVVGTEDFRCAPGPAGWRYVAAIETHGAPPTSLDLVVDAGWRIALVRIDNGVHELLLEAAGDDALRGARDGAPIDVAYGRDLHLDVFTPATNAVTCRRLDGTAEIDVVYVDPDELQPRRVRQRYERHADERVATPAGSFDATRWTFTSLDSGWSADLWVAGDVVVRYERLFDLERYEPGASGPRLV
jgi:hypothetical protein